MNFIILVPIILLILYLNMPCLSDCEYMQVHTCIGNQIIFTESIRQINSIYECRLGDWYVVYNNFDDQWMVISSGKYLYHWIFWCFGYTIVCIIISIYLVLRKR